MQSYNTVRHCTSVYALIESLEVKENQKYWPKIYSAIQYAIDHFYKEKQENIAFMIDGETDPEIVGIKRRSYPHAHKISRANPR